MSEKSSIPMIDAARERATRVVRLRAICGDTQEEFAKRLGMSVASISGWETARGAGLSKKAARHIVERLNQSGLVSVTERWLYDFQGDEPTRHQTALQQTKLNQETIKQLAFNTYDNAKVLDVDNNHNRPFLSTGDQVVLTDLSLQQRQPINQLCILWHDDGSYDCRFVESCDGQGQVIAQEAHSKITYQVTPTRLGLVRLVLTAP